MGNYKLQCNVRCNTWSVLLNGVEVQKADSPADAIKWIREKAALE